MSPSQLRFVTLCGGEIIVTVIEGYSCLAFPQQEPPVTLTCNPSAVTKAQPLKTSPGLAVCSLKWKSSA